MEENETNKPARRRRRAPRAVVPPDGETQVTKTPEAPSTGTPPAEANAEAPDIENTSGEGEESGAPKRRRRGRRGGRRHRRSREAAEGAGEQVTPDGDATTAGKAASEGEAKRRPQVPPRATVIDAAPDAAGLRVGVDIPARPAPGPPPARRRRRKAVPTAEPTASGQAATATASPSTPVVTAAPETTAVKVAPARGGEQPAKRRSRRRRRKPGVEGVEVPVVEVLGVEVPGVEAAESPQAGLAAAAEPVVAGPVAAAAGSPAPEATEEKTPRKRSRGRRRGGAAEADQVEATGDAAEPKDVGAKGAKGARSDTRPKGKKPAKDAKGTGPEKDEKGDKAVKAEKRETGGRRPSRGRRRTTRPTNGVLPDLPGRKEILVTGDAGELRVALVEDGRLAEIYIERPGKRSFAGNIYMGKVDNVLPGIDAAFVDVGLGRNGFLAVDDIDDPEDGSKRPKNISQMLKPKQPVLVQVSKDPMGSKGARLTGQLSLAGRYLVYVPRGSGVGVSRRLPDEERDRLREICKSLKASDAGLIVRTVAEGKDIDELRRDLKFLSALWTRIKAKAEKVTAPAIVYEEDDVALQVARDLFNDSFAAVLVDDAKRHERLVSYLKKTAPELVERVKLYAESEPLFRAHGIEEQIASALERRVGLPSGGNLVIDHTEALTVIDVNSGRFTSGKGLEDTITHTNLEAAREVVRQLRLRDIGGIIIIDFIDMEHPKNRESVLAKLQAELDTDRTKTYVVEISPLGLVEMTRQNITDGARGILTQACPHCEGKARVLSHETMAMTVERRLRRHLGETAAKAMLVEVNAGVAERLQQTGRVKGLERETKRRFFFEGSRSLPVDTYRILAEGSLAAVEAHRIPLAEEQEVEVELDYGLTYSPADAVANVDGYQVVVFNGRRFLGEKRKVRVTTVSRTGAVAVLCG